MMAETTDMNDQDNIHGKHLHLDISSWSTNVGDSKFGLSNSGKDGNIWKQPEVSNVWGVMPVTGSTWGRNEDYSMFQGLSGDKTENLKSFGSSAGWDNAATDQLSGKSFVAPGSSDVWRGFQEYDPFKRSWGEVDFTASSANDKAAWNTSAMELDKQAENQQQKSAGQLVQKSASMSEISLIVQSGGEVQPSMTASETSPTSLPFKSVSSGNFFTDPLTKPESERSQPDGAEVSQQNKEEIIAKMVNSHDGWGKKPIRQDTPWQMDNAAAGQAQQAPADVNPAAAPGTAIVQTAPGSEVPKADLGSMWNVPDPMSAGGSSSWNTFFNTPSATFSGSNADWISDSDIGLWSGPPPPGCDMSNPNLWSGPHKDGSIAQSSMWSSNPSSSGWPNDLSSDRNPWSNDANLGQFWGGPPKTPDEFLGPKKSIVPGQHGSVMYGGQNVKPIGMWGDAGNVQTETGYWNQPNSMIKDDLRQALSGSNLAAEKILSMINSGGRLMKESVDPPRGRMLRGKSVIETSDYNQPFSGLQRGAGGSNFSTSAFQPPQQLYNQQLQQQLLLQKAGLLGTGFQHGRSTSHITKMDGLPGSLGSGMGLNQPMNSGPKNLNLIQMCLHLQSILQPLLVERSQLQQNKVIPLSQKKSRLDVLNQDISKVKAYIDGLQLMSGTNNTQAIGSGFNQSDLSILDEARLRQALGQMKMDPYNSSFPLGSFLGSGNNSTANDLASLLQNVNISGNPNPMGNWLPNMMSNMPGSDSNTFLQGQSSQHQDLWGSYLGKPSGFGGVPPPPPGLGPTDKMGGPSLMGQQGFFGRSTSWAPGEKSKAGYITNWLLIKNTSSIEPQLLHSICGQCGTLQQLLSNKLTGHSLACFKDDSLSVQAKLQQIGNLASDCLSSQDVFNLLDTKGCGGVAAAWVNVSSTAAATSTSTAAAPIASNTNGAAGGVTGSE